MSGRQAGLFWYLFKHKVVVVSSAPEGFPSMDFTNDQNSMFVAAISHFAM